MSRNLAIYTRVSTKDQTQASQLPELQRFARGQASKVLWFADTFTGRSMRRPAMDKLLAAARAGQIDRIVCWRLDRLGRTASGLTALFAELEQLGVGLVSLREGLDLQTPAGRLLAHVIASVAQYETEIRAERVKAGQNAAREKGKKWGGSRPGRRYRVTAERERLLLQMHRDEKPIAVIARTLGLSRPTVYAVLGRHVAPTRKRPNQSRNRSLTENRPRGMPQESRRAAEEGSDTPADRRASSVAK